MMQIFPKGTLASTSLYLHQLIALKCALSRAACCLDIFCITNRTFALLRERRAGVSTIKLRDFRRLHI